MNSPDTQPATPVLFERDRRLHPRYTVQVQIEIHEEGSDIPMRLETIDLSRGGCYVRLLHPLALATYVQVTLWLQNSPVRVRGRVVTRHPQYGNGIMFLELEGTGEQLLSSYLDAIPV